MDSFPEVCSKDARVDPIWPSRLPVPGSFLGHTTLDHQRTLAPESEDSSFVGNQEVVYFIRPLVHFPQDHLYLSRIWIRPPKTMIASTLTALPTLCPDLQAIGLYSLPMDLMISAAVSGILLVTNRNTVPQLYIDSPFTESRLQRPAKWFTNYPTYAVYRCLLRGRLHYPQRRFQI